MRRFEGNVAVVTGGGHGIGEATARRLGAEGATIALADVKDPTPAIARLAADEIEAHPYVLDVSDEQAVDDFADRVNADLGPVDILVNNAGVLRTGTALTVALEDWRRTFSVNVDGLLLMARAFLPGMIERGAGAIVNVASTGGLYGVGNLVAYNASKGAVVNLTRNLSTDFMRAGVRINCVCPGWVQTGFNDPLLEGVTEEAVEQLIDRTVPAGRQSDPSEIAAAIAFLASDDASYVSGIAFVVDGGLTAML